MSPFARAQAGYAMAPTVRTERSVEYEAFARVTSRLRGARDADFPELAAAVHDNTRLWIVLAADVATPGNALPEVLRAQLFSLGEFAQSHGRQVLKGGANVDALIDINTAVMRGLERTER